MAGDDKLHQAHGGHREREDDEGDRVTLVLPDKRRREGKEGDEAEVDEVLRQQAAVDASEPREEPVVRQPVAADHVERDGKADDLGEDVLERLEHVAGAAAIHGKPRHVDLEDEQRHRDREDRVAEVDDAAEFRAAPFDAWGSLLLRHRARLQRAASVDLATIGTTP